MVYCTITGFGTAGGAQLAGYDLLVQALGGLMSVTGQPEGGPTKVGVALVDVLTGLNAFSGILLGLRARDAADEPEAQHVELDLLSTLLSRLVNQSGATLATGVSPTRLGNAHPSIAPYEVFQAADRELVIAVGNDEQFAVLAATLGLDRSRRRPSICAEPRPRSRTAPSCGPHRGRPGGRHRSRLGEPTHTAPVAAGLVNTIGEAFDFAAGARARARDRIVDPAGGAPLRQVANPIHLGGSAARYDRVPPALGEHADAEWLPREGTP